MFIDYAYPVTWKDDNKDMPQIHLQCALSISLFLMQKGMQAYNKNPHLHALAKNSRKCFVFSIHPSNFETPKEIKIIQGGRLDVAKKKHLIYH